MNETLAAIQAWPVLRPQIVIGGVHEKVRDGRLVDEAVLGFALSGIDDLRCPGRLPLPVAAKVRKRSTD
jgi:chromate reductase, NAD(P)H dehydrogenase (quinone)